MFDPITLKLSVDPLILSALKEDVTSEDVTTNSVMREACMGQVDLICKLKMVTRLKKVSLWEL